MRGVAIANQPRHIADRDRLLGEQLARGGQAPRDEVLVEGLFSEERIRALQLARGARERAGDRLEREIPTVVARNEHPRKEVEATALAQRGGTHISYSDSPAPAGRRG